MKPIQVISIIVVGLALCALSVFIGVPYMIKKYNKHKKKKND